MIQPQLLRKHISLTDIVQVAFQLSQHFELKFYKLRETAIFIYV
jgi:hypothetical protein